MIPISNLAMASDVYHGNAALWELLTEKRKENLTHESSHTQDDWKNYFEIMKKTNVFIIHYLNHTDAVRCL